MRMKQILLKNDSSSASNCLLHELREAYEKEKYFDMKIYCGSNPKPIFCHSVVILTTSSILKKVGSNVLESEDMLEVILPDTEREEVAKFFNEIYENISEMTQLNFELSTSFQYLLSQSTGSDNYDSGDNIKVEKSDSDTNNAFCDTPDELNSKGHEKTRKGVKRTEKSDDSFAYDDSNACGDSFENEVKNDSDYENQDPRLVEKGTKIGKRKRRKILDAGHLVEDNPRSGKDLQDSQELLNPHMENLERTLNTQSEKLCCDFTLLTSVKYKSHMLNPKTLSNENFALCLLTSRDNTNFYLRSLLSRSYTESFGDFYKYYKLCCKLSDKDMVAALIWWQSSTPCGTNGKLVKELTKMYKDLDETKLRALLQEKSDELRNFEDLEISHMNPLSLEGSKSLEINNNIELSDKNLVNDVVILELKSKKPNCNFIEMRSLIPPKGGSGFPSNHELAKAFFKLSANWFKVKGPKFVNVEPYKSIYDSYLQVNSHKRALEICLNIDYKQICMHCGKYIHKKAFKKHEQLCKINNTPCNCGLKFITEPEWRTHMKMVHSEDFKFKCKLCSFLGTKEGVEKHEKEDHQKRICEECGVSCSTRNEYMVHRRNFHKECKCEDCGDIVFGYKNFKLHRQKLHTGLKFQCGKCDKVCKSQWDLTFHKKFHLPESQRKYGCSQCDKRFVTHPALKAHVNSMHVGARIWKCRYDPCDKAFTDASARRQHENRIHLGIKRTKAQ